MLFLRKGLADTAQWIDGEGSFRGDAERGKGLYSAGLGTNESCASCHGQDGLEVPPGSADDYDEFVGKIARKNPWEFLHKVRYGQPGAKMPAAIRGGASLREIVDLGAYAQTLPVSR